MNFRTTIILIILLAAGLVFVFVASRDGEKKDEQGNEQVDRTGGRKLFDASSGDIDRLVIKPANGAPIELAKADGKWKIVQPIAAPATEFEADSLVSAVTGLKSRGSAPGDDLSKFGLDKPRYSIEATGKDKKVKLDVGNNSSLGKDLYVKVDGAKNVELAIGASLYDKLDKGAEKLVISLRDKSLVRLTSNDIKQMEIKHGDQTLVLNKVGGDWKLVEPVKEDLESSDVSDLLFELTRLQADEFIPAKSPLLTGAKFDQPQLTVWLSGAAPSTQPSTQPASKPAGTTIVFGEYANIDKDKIFVKVSDGDTLAKVSMNETNLNKLLNATPISLRDKKVLDVDPNQVSKLTVAMDQPSTTQPTTKPAKRTDVTISRRKQIEIKGPALPVGVAAPSTKPAATKPVTKPATKPTPAPQPAPEPATAPTTVPTTVPAAAPQTQPAATQAAAAPAVPAAEAAVPKPPAQLDVKWPEKTVWQVDSDPKGDANDTAVNDLLNALHPLRADKYVEKNPTTQPATSYTVEVTTEAPGGAKVTQYTLKITDRGGELPLIGSHNGLVFELPRTFLKNVQADFRKKAE